jgi:hypothetical protein
MRYFAAACAAFCFFFVLAIITSADAEAGEVNLYWQSKDGTLIVLSNKLCETELPQKMKDAAKQNKLYQAYGYEHVGTERETQDMACWFSEKLPSEEEAADHGVPAGAKLIQLVTILVPDGFVTTQPMDMFKLMVPEVTKKELF